MKFCLRIARCRLLFPTRKLTIYVKNYGNIAGTSGKENYFCTNTCTDEAHVNCNNLVSATDSSPLHSKHHPRIILKSNGIELGWRRRWNVGCLQAIIVIWALSHPWICLLKLGLSLKKSRITKSKSCDDFDRRQSCTCESAWTKNAFLLIFVFI